MRVLIMKNLKGEIKCEGQIVGYASRTKDFGRSVREAHPTEQDWILPVLSRFSKLEDFQKQIHAFSLPSSFWSGIVKMADA